MHKPDDLALCNLYILESQRSGQHRAHGADYVFGDRYREELAVVEFQPLYCIFPASLFYSVQEQENLVPTCKLVTNHVTTI